jgi:hypothetical protein
MTSLPAGRWRRWRGGSGESNGAIAHPLNDGDDFGIEPPQPLPSAPGRLHAGEKVRDLLGCQAQGYFTCSMNRAAE